MQKEKSEDVDASLAFAMRNNCLSVQGNFPRVGDYSREFLSVDQATGVSDEVSEVETPPKKRRKARKYKFSKLLGMNAMMEYDRSWIVIMLLCVFGYPVMQGDPVGSFILDPAGVLAEIQASNATLMKLFMHWVFDDVIIPQLKRSLRAANLTRVNLTSIAWSESIPLHEVPWKWGMELKEATVCNIDEFEREDDVLVNIGQFLPEIRATVEGKLRYHDLKVILSFEESESNFSELESFVATGRMNVLVGLKVRGELSLIQFADFVDGNQVEIPAGNVFSLENVEIKEMRLMEVVERKVVLEAMKISLVLTNPKSVESLLQAGDIIQGYVHVQFEDNPKAEELYLRLCGHGELGFTIEAPGTAKSVAETYTGPNLMDPMLPPGVAYATRTSTRRLHRRQTYADHSFHLWSKSQNARVIQLTPFDGAFPFMIQTPIELPPTLKTIYGKISYSLEVVMKRPNYYDVSNRTAIVIEAHVPIHRSYGLSWFDVSETLDLGDWLGTREQVEFVIRIPSRSFVMGESVDLLCRVTNNSRHMLTNGKVLLIQKVTHLADGFRKETNNVLIEVRFVDVPSGVESYEWIQRIVLPSGNPPSFSNLKFSLMEVEYYLEISTTPKAFYAPFEIVIPIEIGTVLVEERHGVSSQPGPMDPVEVPVSIPPQDGPEILRSRPKKSRKSKRDATIQMTLLAEIRADFGSENLLIPIHGLGRDKPPSAVIFLQKSDFGGSSSALTGRDLSRSGYAWADLDLRMRLSDVVVPFFLCFGAMAMNKMKIRAVPLEEFSEFERLVHELLDDFGDRKLVRLLLTFWNLKGDTAKFDFILRLLRNWDVSVISCSKSEDKSTSLRKNANYFAEIGHYAQALPMYNKCLAFAPAESQEILRLAYFNRAVTLFFLGRYRECLVDLERCCALKGTEESVSHVYYWKAKCHMMLENFDLARNNALLAKESSIPAKERTIDNLLRKIEKASSCSPSVEQKYPGILEQPDGSRGDLQRAKRSVCDLQEVHEVIPEISSKLKFCRSAERGRHVVAAENLMPGEVICVEKPVAATLSHLFWDTHCFHCYKLISAPVPCMNCSAVFYCDEDCLKMNCDTHARECKFIGNLGSTQLGNFGFLPLRAALQTDHLGMILSQQGKELYDVIEKSGDKEDSRTLLESYLSCEDVHPYFRMCSLIKHEKAWDSRSSLWSAMLVAYYIRLLEKTGFFANK
ncbi:unnamed protein product [Notodromas monacha]|uniref:Arrestin C-terminal-like domain-containing protein n=1 Tax=Notodromas monacha TaxID=399045 RepID=A0A7R9BSF9_9CRUS|nr:unnamed protein product [Notodromas monacha]CAG0919491.1 unnamed protein product [Notodromas monacha]